MIKSGKWGIAAFGASTWSIERNYIKEDGARSNASNWGQSLLQRTPGAGPAMDGSPTMFARALELRSPEATASSPAAR